MPGDSPEALEVARTEVRVAEQLAEHPHAVRLLAASPRPPQLRTDCFLLMELCQARVRALCLAASASIFTSVSAGVVRHSSAVAPGRPAGARVRHV
jgi:hypothetical protein